jgi:chromosome segregation ATPase
LSDLMDNTAFINCYLQKKLSRSEALELLSKQNNMPQNDDERIIFTEDSMQPVTSVAPPPLSRSTVPKITILPQVPQQLHRISSTAKTYNFLNTSKNDELNNPKTEYIKLKIDHEKLKTEHEKLRQEFDTFKEETEHRIQQLFLAVTRQGSSEDLMVVIF